jgi:glycosyltransferase involved in cell wall biosynthesis
MKIAYIIDHLRADGTQRALTQLIEGLAARGHTQAVLCLNDSWDESLVTRLRATMTDVRIVGKLALATGGGLWQIWRQLRREQFDVVVTLLFASDVIGRALAGLAGTPRIVSSLRAHNTNYTAWQRRLVRLTMRWASAVVLNSAAVRDFAINVEGAPPTQIYVIPNGVVVDNKRTPIERSALGLPPKGRLLGSVGRLSPQKGLDVLIDALALLPCPDVQLLLIGIGEEEPRLRAQAARLGLQQRVLFAGYRRDVPQLLTALDLYVHPARFEGMPNALLEAMAASCPIIASAVDGNCELIEDGIHGWLVMPDNARALATAIQDALGDPAEAQRRGAAAQQRATTQFSCEAMVAAWEQVLGARS